MFADVQQRSTATIHFDDVVLGLHLSDSLYVYLVIERFNCCLTNGARKTCGAATRANVAYSLVESQGRFSIDTRNRDVFETAEGKVLSNAVAAFVFAMCYRCC